MKAIWNNQILAESNNTIELEGNHYFPPGSIQSQNFEKSQTNTICGWKGTASYYNIKVDGKINPDAAWYYPEPKDAAINIKDFVAFWRGVEVTK